LAALNTERALVPQLALFRGTREQRFEQEAPSAGAEQPAQSIRSAAKL